MRKHRCALFALFLASASRLEAESRVQSVSVQGGPNPLQLQTRAGAEYDAGMIEKDVRSLYATQRFRDIRVGVSDGATGKIVIFQVSPSPRVLLRNLHITPDDLPVKPAIPRGTPIDEAQGYRIAGELRASLMQQGYADASVTSAITPAGYRQADLHLRVEASGPLRVRRVTTSANDKTAAQAVDALRVRRLVPGIPGLWEGWSLQPTYSRSAAASDAARIRSAYVSRGYLDAAVRVDHAPVRGNQVDVNIALKPGTKYQVSAWQVGGAGLKSQSRSMVGSFAAKGLCDCLFKLRRESERQGILDFAVRMSAEPAGGDGNSVKLVAEIEQGRGYRIGRIDIAGNSRVRDASIRSHLLLDESDLLDSTLLRKSLDRLNRSGLFEPLNEKNVALHTDAESRAVDVRIRLTERRLRSWFLSGPVGPMSIAGPLQFTLASRLPAWGSGLLDLSSYYASFSLVSYGYGRKFGPVMALDRRFSPAEGWRSGFSIAPQLGWRSTLLNYGGVQLRERLAPLLDGGTHLMPPLTVTLERPGGDVEMVCEAPQPRLRWVRKGLGLALQVAGSLAAL